MSDYIKAGEVFESDLAEDLRDPAFREAFELQRAKTRAIAQLMEIVEATRAEKHLSKAEVGRRIGKKPSAISRLLSGNGQNPTLETLSDMLYAVGLQAEVRIKPAPKSARKPQPMKVVVSGAAPRVVPKAT